MIIPEKSVIHNGKKLIVGSREDWRPIPGFEDYSISNYGMISRTNGSKIDRWCDRFVWICGMNIGTTSQWLHKIFKSSELARGTKIYDQM